MTSDQILQRQELILAAMTDYDETVPGDFVGHLRLLMRDCAEAAYQPMSGP